MWNRIGAETGSPRARAEGGVRPGQEGVTMLDVTIALVVVAIGAVALVPAIQRSLVAYQRSGAARMLVAEIRAAQSYAVSRGGIYAVQWGDAVGRPAGEYRIVRDTTSACGLPAVGAAEDGTNVLKSWTDLGDTHSQVTVQSVVDKNGAAVGAVMFNSRGASLNTCSGVSYPVTVTVADRYGFTRQVEVRAAGSVRLL